MPFILLAQIRITKTLHYLLKFKFYVMYITVCFDAIVEMYSVVIFIA